MYRFTLSLFLLATYFIAFAQSPTPFSCSPDFYQIIDRQLHVLDPSTGSYDEIGSPHSTYSTINAVGYNTADNFIYGIGTVTGTGVNRDQHLLRIGANGDIVALVSPLFTSTPSYIAGDIDVLNRLVVTNSNTTQIRIIDNLTTTPTTILKTTTGATISGTVADWARNPIDDNFYGMQPGSASLIYSFDPSATSPVTINTTSIVGGTIDCNGQGFGAVWFDNSGNFYASCNDDGIIYSIDISTGSYSALSLSLPMPTGNNDGASCPLAGSPFQPIPTLSQWMLFLLGMILTSVALIYIRNSDLNTISHYSD